MLLGTPTSTPKPTASATPGLPPEAPKLTMADFPQGTTMATDVIGHTRLTTPDGVAWTFDQDQWKWRPATEDDPPQADTFVRPSTEQFAADLAAAMRHGPPGGAPPHALRTINQQPDFVVLSLGSGAPVGPQGSGNLIVDRYGRLYIGPTGGIGASFPDVSGSLMIGYVQRPTVPDPDELYDFLQGLGVTTQAGLVFSAGTTLSSNGQLAIMGGIASPQLSEEPGWNQNIPYPEWWPEELRRGWDRSR
jgi:hypothetical protein